MPENKTYIQQSIADLEAWRDRIEVTIQTLRLLDANGPILPAVPPPPGTSRSAGEIPGDAFFQMTVPDAAEKYLKIMKATKELFDIAEALLKGGLKSSSQNFSNMVRAVIGRDSRFVKVPDGTWGLTEWYPAMRKEKKLKLAEPKVAAVSPSAASQKPEPQEETVADKILAAMKRDPNGLWTANTITTATGLNKKTVQGTIFRLRKSEQITNRPNGSGYVLC